VLSSLLYVVATDVFAAAQWDNYSRTQEMVSKLFAVGSPSRGPALIVLVGGAYTALMIAFGFGVWASAHRNRALRVTGALLIAYGAANILRTFFPLDLNNDASGSNAHCGYEHAAHIDAGCHNLRGRGVHGWLRVCSIASLVTSIVAGIVSFMAAPYEPTLVLGIAERISIGAFLLWVAVLAVALWRTPSVQPMPQRPQG